MSAPWWLVNSIEWQFDGRRTSASWSGGEKQKGRNYCPEVPEVLNGELSLTTSSIKKYNKCHLLFPDMMNTLIWWALTRHHGHLHLDRLTSSLLLPLLFCETIHWREGCHVKTVFRGFDATGKWKLQRKQTADVQKWFKLYWPPVDKLIAWWAYKVLLIILSKIKNKTNVAYPPERHSVNSTTLLFTSLLLINVWGIGEEKQRGGVEELIKELRAAVGNDMVAIAWTPAVSSFGRFPLVLSLL